MMAQAQASDKKVKCGVVGVGSLGQHHARLYGALPEVELVGIYDNNAERAAEIADRNGGQVFSSIEELGAACEAISVVVPTHLHREIALPLLAQGCHLLIEKPICASLQEAEEVLAAAKAANRIVQVGHIEHFNPVMSFLEENVHDPRFITAERLAPFTPRGTDVGVVLDLMIHDIGIIMELVKSPLERVEAVGVQVLTAHEDIANARLVFENGCVANLNTSRVSLKKVREIRVFQPETYLSLNFMEQSGHLIRKQGPTLDKQDIPIERDEPLKLELASFAETVRKAGDPKFSGDMGKTALEVAIQITDLIRAGWKR
ncbi:MAG: oxidoreductase domain-containing protein [Puniceicoccaceae bacterium 5H]|nr:MAG: oxidoreductase domain-containing protein [Puniceicoccaceae bacterium 5H]